MLKFILILGALLWLWHSPAVRSWRGIKPPSSQRPANKAAAPSSASAQRETMVQCTHCGVHLPQSEALTSASGRTYCCAEHRLAERT